MKTHKFFLILLLVIWLMGCSEFSVKYEYQDDLTRTTYVQNHYGSDSVEGLKYINDEAIKFLSSYNEINQTNWRSLEPDARVLVSKCIVPMRTEWSDKNHAWPQEKAEIWSVNVMCDKAKIPKLDEDGWSVLVPTNRPIKSMK